MRDARFWADATRQNTLRKDNVWASAILGRLCLTLLIILPFQGCGGSGSGKSNTPVVTPKATITSPAAEFKTGVLPIPVTVQLSNGATLGKVSITVDGVDVTSSFSSTGNDTITGQLSSTQVYVGSNRLVANVVSGTGALTPSSNVTFTYDPTAAPHAVATTYDAPPADVVPILTHVNANGLPSVQLSNRAITAVNLGTLLGFQVIKLDRTSLRLVSNQTFQVQDAPSMQAFLQAIVPQAANITDCGYNGCLEIIQSLSGPGWNPCVSGDDQTCSAYRSALTSIGGTATITYTPSASTDIGYSYIGNVGQDTLHAGSMNERVDCQSSTCGSFPVPDQSFGGPVDEGLVPNGAGADVMPTINNTVKPACPTTTATPSMPAVTYCLAGSIQGVLLRSGDQTYVFSYADPSVRFSMVTDPSNIFRSIFTLSGSGNVQSLSVESANLPPSANNTHVGGFHLVILDATDLSLQFNRTYTVWLPGCSPNGTPPSFTPAVSCTGPDGSTIYNLQQLYQDIRQYNSRRYLFFLRTVGHMDHDYAYGLNNQTDHHTGNSPNTYYAQDIWDRIAQGVQDLGGSFVTFANVNNAAFQQNAYDQYIPHGTTPQDDYIMAGQWWINASGVANPYAAEESTQISRQTINTTTPPYSAMYGVLGRERDGFYQVTSESLDPDLSPQTALDLNNASLTPPVNWPISSSSTGGTLAAYTWISNQLLNCITGCTDIHNAYANLNVSPNSWQALLAQLNPPTDNGDGFSPSDYQAVKGQLSLEFQYLAAVRSYQNNLQNLLQAEQANLSVILQQVVSNVNANVPVNQIPASTSYGNWRNELKDSLAIAGAFSSVIPVADSIPKAVIASADLAIDASAKNTVDARGRTLEELSHVDTAYSQLAQQKAQQFAAILTTEGNQFVRISNDWQRLQSVGRPLANNTIPWTADALGPLLSQFDVALTRSLYRRILNTTYDVVQYRYSSPGVHELTYLYPQFESCDTYLFLGNQSQNSMDPTAQNTFYPFAFWPGAPIDGLAYRIEDAGNTGSFDLWWDVWVMYPKGSLGHVMDCPRTGYTSPRSFYTNTGIFDRLDPSDSTRLGLYKPYFFQRSGFTITQYDSPHDAAEFWESQGSNAGYHFDFGSGNAQLDPVSY